MPAVTGSGTSPAEAGAPSIMTRSKGARLRGVGTDACGLISDLGVETGAHRRLVEPAPLGELLRRELEQPLVPRPVERIVAVVQSGPPDRTNLVEQGEDIAHRVEPTVRRAPSSGRGTLARVDPFRDEARELFAAILLQE